MKKNLLVILIASFCARTLSAQSVSWPEVTVEAKPAARWWWMGSAVDAANLTHNLEAYSKAGMGTMEITPIYGVQGNDANDIQFLSPQWMQMLRHTESEAARLGMKIDMNTGTGWPFGGPEVSIEDAACKLLIEEYTLKGGERLKEKVEVTDEKQRPYARLARLMAFRVLTDSSTPKEQKAVRCYNLTSKLIDGKLNWKAPKGEWRLIAAFVGKTFQKVKRSAPGGEGYVMNHFSAKAVSNYLGRFERAFAGQTTDGSAGTPTAYPHNFFNDSYEVYGADWTDDLFEQFARRRGYKLEEHLPEFLSQERTETTRRIVSDYRETLAELLQENFTRQWTDWAHKHGSRTRNQAHGSPGNLIDLYATVDVPECEGFGLSDFGISGLRKDSLTRPNDSDLSMLKYASSAAHIAGKPFTTSETFTWLTEHFRTSLSQCKPDIDLMFVSGVNHTYFHGTTYSPVQAAWPGWKFYASIDMSPTNNIWRDAPAFFDYITRCQSFLQMGQPDNDFLVYLPVYDMWDEQGGRLLLFDIHKMARRAPRFIEAVHRIYDAGYDMDYISDNFIRNAMCQDGKILTSGGVSYKALVVPGARLMPADVLEKLLQLADEGAMIVFLEQYPEDVPGLNSLSGRRAEFNNVLAQIKEREGKGNVIFGTDYVRTLAATAAVPEEMKTTFGLSIIRRSNPEGHHYFISALKAEDTEGWVPLAVQARSAMLYNPMNGTSGKARLRQNNGRTEVFLQLASGESVILKTFDSQEVDVPEYGYWSEMKNLLSDRQWGFRFVEATPAVGATPDSVSLGSWTELAAEGARHTMGTACYTTTFTVKNPADAGEWMLDLGDVRESARVRINGQEVATLFAVPYRCLAGKYLHAGVNTLEVEVTNLPANRIADMDRRNVPWRIYKDANIVNIHYKKDNYGKWEPVPSGLLGPVRLIPMQALQ
ncbi:alpha-L-rhamnosidase [Bacteroides stercorirosoris]|uniref:Glycosyl hydrolase family 2 n=1 Tax=Bacteroides stercorirosoris TaxID=871324 RepID=A0A413HAS5_9BACE|nr:glycosyl hydrolase [Bacteroides stercorirosoris]RGX80787.1 glycosyl hydrolase family 2 [Bacteroides stercorirosoris]